MNGNQKTTDVVKQNPSKAFPGNKICSKVGVKASLGFVKPKVIPSSMTLCDIRPTGMWEVQIMQGAIFGPSIRGHKTK
ncbi:MAG: hypothetical protein Q9M92_08675 [Enterobacterales bacterium]|nr:hypothetical protein [Enterobacterales bacterium]